jgi:hypothetical protein
LTYSNTPDGRSRSRRRTTLVERSLHFSARVRAIAKFPCKSPLYSARHCCARFRALRAVRCLRGLSRYRAVLRERDPRDRNSVISRTFAAITRPRAPRCRRPVWRALPRSANCRNGWQSMRFELSGPFGKLARWRPETAVSRLTPPSQGRQDVLGGRCTSPPAASCAAGRGPGPLRTSIHRTS